MPESSPTPFEPGQPLHVRLYGRPDCQLCSDAAKLLKTMHGDHDFWVENVNIDDDPAIAEKLHEHIPVVTFNGAHRVSVPVTDEKLRRAFKKSTRSEETDHAAATEAYLKAGCSRSVSRS